MTVYQVINKDLSELGKDFVGEIWDCLIQEVNLETGDLVFQWRASDHYKVSDTLRDIGDDGVIGRAFDFFHMNSIAKDSNGNYLTSSRYLHSLTYINGTDGEIIWILGGKGNMFRDLSDGNATNFAYQHDARWSDDHTTVTMFDNGVDDSHSDTADTRGLRVELDEEKMTAKVVAEYRTHMESMAFLKVLSKHFQTEIGLWDMGIQLHSQNILRMEPCFAMLTSGQRVASVLEEYNRIESTNTLGMVAYNQSRYGDLAKR